MKLGLHIIDGNTSSKIFLNNELQYPLQSEAVTRYHLLGSSIIFFIINKF